MTDCQDVKIFYFSPQGDDGFENNSRATPWRDPQKFIDSGAADGASLLFEGSAVFYCQLEIGGLQGSAGAPVIIGSYGQGRAILDAGAGSALMLENCAHVRIAGLELRGCGWRENEGGFGLSVKNCCDVEIDDIDVSGFQAAGVNLDGVRRCRVTNVHAHDNGFAGIISGVGPSEDLYIGYCRAINNAGDPRVRENHSGSGILLAQTERALVEYCEAAQNGWGMENSNYNGPVGIWIWDCRHVTIQFCISHDNKTQEKNADGGGFDFDGGAENCLMQFNYSYDNAGPGYLLCNWGWNDFPTRNNTLRFCISQNDGRASAPAGIYSFNGGYSDMQGFTVHNNIVYNSEGRYCVLGAPLNSCFMNNIFITDGETPLAKNIELAKFVGNCYWNESGHFDIDGCRSFEDWVNDSGQERFDGKLHGFFADPQLQGKLPARKITAPRELPQLFEFLLQPGSPCIDSGIDIKKYFGIALAPQDFYGQPLERISPCSIGIDERRAR